MSAPDTNTTKQTRRHRPVLIGISLAALAVILVILMSVNLGNEDASTSPSDESAITGPGSPALAPAEMDAPYLSDPGAPAPSDNNATQEPTE